VAERQWDPGAVFHRDGLPWNERPVLLALTAACLAALLALLATAFFAEVGRGRGLQAGGTTVIYASSAGEAAPLPLSPAQPARRTEPRTVTLRASDLPPGARLSKEGPASFSANELPPPSWDVVIRPDPGQPAGYEFAESLAVVYPNDQVAASAMASLSTAERANGATEVAASPPVGDRQTVWVEQTRARPGAAIVRVNWQSMNVVGEVSILGQAGPGQVQRAVQLALVEQDRIGAPVPFDEQK